MKCLVIVLKTPFVAGADIIHGQRLAGRNSEFVLFLIQLSLTIKHVSHCVSEDLRKNALQVTILVDKSANNELTKLSMG